MATAATVYMSTMGPEGFREVAERSYQNAHYLAKQVEKRDGYAIATPEPYFHEFAIKCPVYVVSCGQDRLTPAAAVRKVAALYPQASLRHYPGRGHWVLDDVDTDEMATEIANWLQGHEQRVAARGRE